MELTKEIEEYRWSNFGKKMICQLVLSVEEHDFVVSNRLLLKVVFEYTDSREFQRREAGNSRGYWVERLLSGATEKERSAIEGDKKFRSQSNAQKAHKQVTIEDLVTGHAWYGDEMELDDYFQRLYQALEGFSIQLERGVVEREQGGQIYGFGKNSRKL